VLFVQLPDALSRNGIRSRSLVCAILDSRVTEKNPSRAEIRGLGRRPPSGRLCRKSRAANHVRGVRDPQSSPRADCRSPWCLSSGAARLRGRRGDRRITVTVPFYRLPFCRDRVTPRTDRGNYCSIANSLH
jgi:hypothetical protein